MLKEGPAAGSERLELEEEQDDEEMDLGEIEK